MYTIHDDKNIFLMFVWPFVLIHTSAVFYTQIEWKKNKTKQKKKTGVEINIDQPDIQESPYKSQFDTWPNIYPSKYPSIIRFIWKQVSTVPVCRGMFISVKMKEKVSLIHTKTR